MPDLEEIEEKVAEQNARAAVSTIENVPDDLGGEEHPPEGVDGRG